ncbi:MAG: TIGR02147 family protein [Fibrobacter sp.]|nr:TIGR02147 family protein [Fibrobacter sp.]
MKSILYYKDYHKYMQDYYNERKLHSAFSWREFSSIAGFSSPVYMKLVCEGKNRLSKSRMGQVADALNLHGYEKEFFEQMVIYDGAKKESTKNSALRKMQDIISEHEIRIVPGGAFEYYSGWENPVLRELVPMMPGASPKEIANACNEDVSPEEVSRVLAFLTKHGFLKKNQNGIFEQTEKIVIGSKEELPLAIRAMHKEMAQIAANAIEKYKPEERHFVGATMGIDEKSYRKITREIERFCKRIAVISDKCENVNQVYRLNVQLFPMSKKI